MTTNLERYKADLAKLVKLGGELHNAMQYAVAPVEIKKQVEKQIGKDRFEDFLKDLPDFNSEYERWYSQALALIQQLLPSRVDDFVRYHKRPANRKRIDHDNYSMQDYLDGLSNGLTRAGPSTAVSLFRQQLAILKACEDRFESSLFEIKQLVQADLFDTEIEMAHALNKRGFHRAAGVVAGVVLEKHLAQVCADHQIKIGKRNPAISDYNEQLKGASVISLPQWRHIALLGDIRNICGHSKEKEPTAEQVADLIDGTDKALKTIS